MEGACQPRLDSKSMLTRFPPTKIQKKCDSSLKNEDTKPLRYIYIDIILI